METQQNSEEKFANLKNALFSKRDDVPVKLDEDYYTISADLFDGILLGELPLNRVFVNVTPMYLKYFHLIKWPLRKPHVKISDSNKNYFFKRFTRKFFQTDNSVTNIQAHVVKKAVELDDAVIYTAKEGAISKILSEYETMFLIRN